jgi:hypothetical protein
MSRRARVMLHSLACSTKQSLWHECAIRFVPETGMPQGDVTLYPTRTHLSQPSVHGRASGAWAYFTVCRHHVAMQPRPARSETI